MHTTQGATCLDFGPFRIDVANRELLVKGEPVALTPKAFDTLLFLVERRGQVISRDQLVEAVWPGTFVTDGTLTQNIYTLRKALAADASARYLETVPRRGYRFVAEVSMVEAATGILAIPPAIGISTNPDLRSLAVLPLRTLGSEEDAFLGLGIADALIVGLSRIHGLAVRATSTVLRYVDAESDTRSDRDAVAAGTALGVDDVLEGSVQRAGRRLRVTVQLVSVARGVAHWGESFQGEYDDLFAAQDAIAHAVVDALRLTLSGAEETHLTEHSTRSSDAYRAYVRGRYLWNQRTARSLEKAIEIFRRAIALDEAYAQPWAGLADAFIQLPLYDAVLPAEAFRQARDAAGRALDLDDRLAEAHTSMAYTDFVYTRRWRAAEDGFRRAMALNPQYPTAHHWVAFLHSARGRHDRAITSIRRAHELDPLSRVIHADLALVLYFARRGDAALRECRAVLDLEPSFAYGYFTLALALSQEGQHNDAVAAARRAVELNDESTAMRAVLGYALAASGARQEARAELEHLGQRGASEWVQSSHLALIQLGLGELDQALELLRRACEERSRFVAFLSVWPIFDPLRSLEGFDDLLERAGFPAVETPPPGR